MAGPDAAARYRAHCRLQAVRALDLCAHDAAILAAATPQRIAALVAARGTMLRAWRQRRAAAAPLLAQARARLQGARLERDGLGRDGRERRP